MFFFFMNYCLARPVLPKHSRDEPCEMGQGAEEFTCVGYLKVNIRDNKNKSVPGASWKIILEKGKEETFKSGKKIALYSY